MRGIDGRVIAITGGGSGMGRAMAIDLARHGARIASHRTSAFAAFPARRRIIGPGMPGRHCVVKNFEIHDFAVGAGSPFFRMG